MNDSTQADGTIISLEGEDGAEYACQLLDVIDFEDHRYAKIIATRFC